MVLNNYRFISTIILEVYRNRKKLHIEEKYSYWEKPKMYKPYDKIYFERSL